MVFNPSFQLARRSTSAVLHQAPFPLHLLRSSSSIIPRSPPLDRTASFSSKPSASPDLSQAPQPLSIFSESSISLVDELSDYLIYQPFPSLSYTSTVILTTILVRTSTTLPISIWSRIRINRFESIVLPTFKAFRTTLALHAKRKFLDPNQIPVYQAHLQSKIRQELDRLIVENRCRPSVTILGSLCVHLPVIYTLTSILRSACQRVPPGSALVLEPSPILGSSLIEPDLGLALICWAAFLINVELNASFRYLRRSTASDDRSPSQASAQSKTSFISRGLKFWNPETIRTASFLAGIAMMGISASQPALVLTYWLTSNCFSILQSLCFIYLDSRKSAQLSFSKTAPGSTPVPIPRTDQRITKSGGRSDPKSSEDRKSKKPSSSLPPIL